jgi:uncharacterized protein
MNSDWFSHKRLIGMVHLGPLPGSARYAGDLGAVLQRAEEDARALEAGGIDAVMVENFFDAPFYKSEVPPHTIAAMTAAVFRLRGAISLPLGVNVLRNDARSAVAIAHVCSASFIRCNVYVGAAITDQGLIEGVAQEVVAYRRALGANIAIWADVEVKHAVQLGGTPVEQQAQDAVERGMADALIVTGAATGLATPIERLRSVRGAVPRIPLLVGSGLTPENAVEVMRIADGAIVGSSLKRGGEISGPVDSARVRELVEAVRSMSR